MLVAKEFDLNDKESLLDMVDEINNFDANFEGLNNIKNIDNYEDFLLKLEKNKHQELIKAECSPQTTFGVWDDKKLIGGFNLRHIIKGNLINHGGNIGYLIRPTESKKGYGTKLLELAIKEAKKLGLKKVLVSCRKENIGSEKVIINNNGIYENDYYDESKNETYKRFWIEIE